MNTISRVKGGLEFISVSQKQMAAALELTPARINQLIDEGIIIRDESSRVGEVMMLESLRNFYLSKKATGEGVNFWKERALHEKAKRELAELKVSERRGELYEAATVEAVLTELLIDFRNKLLGLGHRTAPRLAGLTVGEICAELDREIEELLNELAAESDEERIRFGTPSAGNIEDAAESEREPMGGDVSATAE